jgi:hypothetical protein
LNVGGDLNIASGIYVTGVGVFKSTLSVTGTGSFGSGILSSGLISAGSGVRFLDADATNWVQFQAPSSVGSNVTWILPSEDATVSGYALVSDASGNLSWAAASGGGGGATGGGTDEVFYENDQFVTTNYTIPSGKNAMTAGRIVINSGVDIGVPSGSYWVVV